MMRHFSVFSCLYPSVATQHTIFRSVDLNTCLLGLDCLLAFFPLMFVSFITSYTRTPLIFANIKDGLSERLVFLIVNLQF